MQLGQELVDLNTGEPIYIMDKNGQRVEFTSAAVAFCHTYVDPAADNRRTGTFSTAAHTVENLSISEVSY